MDRWMPASARNTATATTVSARIVKHLIDLGISAGISRDLMLAGAGVTDDDLRDPDAHVPVVAEIALWQLLARDITEPEFGVCAGERWRLRTIGLVGYVAQFSETLRGALQRVARYGRLFTEAVQIAVPTSRSEILLTSARPALGPGHALAESYRLSSILQASRELTRVHIVPAEVAFTYAQPSMVLAHRRHFGDGLHFGARTARIRFREEQLDLPVVGADETLARYLGNYAEQELERLVRGDTVSYAVRAAIWSLLGDGTPSLKQVADAVHIPTRTLQRRLARHGTSLQAEIEGIRKTMAVAMLRGRSVSIGEVAFLLGYAEPSTFYRAFKRWTGTSPGQFRQRLA
jgi:AraC-like DNA-binding protein